MARWLLVTYEATIIEAYSIMEETKEITITFFPTAEKLAASMLTAAKANK